MKILIVGSSGFLGSALVPFLTSKGHQVVRLIRKKINVENDVIYWNPEKEEYHLADFEGFDCIINLAGESIFSRWTASKKKALFNSRVTTTALLSKCLSQLQNPPAVFINASAMGYYGSQGAHPVTEESPPGTGFLARLCQEWEEATAPASRVGIRVVCLRFGVVLSPKGGMLEKILPLFRLGLGGSLGPGTQWMSWIALEDVLEVVQFVMENSQIEGGVNVSSPHCVTNATFTDTVGKVLGAPTFATVPALVLHLLLGDMAEETVLASLCMQPKKLKDNGYQFHHSDLKKFLASRI